jgi:hypothetical protein
MRTSKRTLAIPIFIVIVICPGRFGLASARARLDSPPLLPRRDAVLIAGAYHLWQTLGEKLWSGWTQVSIPFIYVATDYEYAIGFPRKLDGYTQLGQDARLGRSIQARKRVFGTHTAASFPYEGVPTVVIGAPTALEKSPAA